jgi:hypothetical protein
MYKEKGTNGKKMHEIKTLYDLSIDDLIETIDNTQNDYMSNLVGMSDYICRKYSCLYRVDLRFQYKLLNDNNKTKNKM